MSGIVLRNVQPSPFPPPLQTGGAGQYGVCFISMEPLEEGSGVLFESKIKGGAIPKPFVASVEK
eukprot:2348897-Rhodomonas_salina.1